MRKRHLKGHEAKLLSSANLFPLGVSNGCGKFGKCSDRFPPPRAPHPLEVCLATDPLSPKFVNQDLLAHIIGDMRLAVSHGDLAEPSLELVFFFSYKVRI